MGLRQAGRFGGSSWGCDRGLCAGNGQVAPGTLRWLSLPVLYVHLLLLLDLLVDSVPQGKKLVNVQAGVPGLVLPQLPEARETEGPAHRELLRRAKGGGLDREHYRVFRANPHVRPLVLETLAAAELYVLGRRVLPVPVDPLPLGQMPDFGVVLGFESSSDLEEAHAFLWVGAGTDVVFADAQSAHVAGQSTASMAGSKVATDDDTVQRLAKFGHVFRFDLDPVVVSAV